jgi:hypothetical protein
MGGTVMRWKRKLKRATRTAKKRVSEEYGKYKRKQAIEKAEDQKFKAEVRKAEKAAYKKAYIKARTKRIKHEAEYRALPISQRIGMEWKGISSGIGTKYQAESRVKRKKKKKRRSAPRFIVTDWL